METSTIDPFNLDSFAENLLIQSGKSTANVVLFDQEKQKIVRQLEDLMGEVIVKNIPSQFSAEMDRISALNDDSALYDFINKVVPNLDELMRKELELYRSLYLPNRQA